MHAAVMPNVVAYILCVMMNHSYYNFGLNNRHLNCTELLIICKFYDIVLHSDGVSCYKH